LLGRTFINVEEATNASIIAPLLRLRSWSTVVLLWNDYSKTCYLSVRSNASALSVKKSVLDLFEKDLEEADKVKFSQRILEKRYEKLTIECAKRFVSN